MTWIPTYSVGVTSIDEQHKRLIALINELHDAMLANRGTVAVNQVLVQLADYCDEHFSYEEGLLQKAQYPGFAIHREKHVRMAEQVRKLTSQAQRGGAVVTLEVMNFLRNWLDKHILGTDKEYAPLLSRKGFS